MMSTLLFLSGNKTNKNKKFDQFIPSYSNHTLKSPLRVKKRKRQASNGSPRYQQKWPQIVTTNIMYPISAPPSPTSSFSSSPALSPLSFTGGYGTTNNAEDTRPASPPPYFHPAVRNNDINDKRWKQLMLLENEMDFTQDTWATLNVMFESVKLAYLNCVPQLTPHPTRLDAMEKELLSAYDDLELQVIHLDRHIQKLESSWYRYKSTATVTTTDNPSLPLVTICSDFF